MASADIRQLTVDDLRGFDAVVHLAELSNDPLGQLNPDVTYEINHRGSVAARDDGPRGRASSASSTCRRAASTAPRRDASARRHRRSVPLTAYAECKVLVERDVAPLADDDFSPTFLRNATAFGASPRMRFDLVVNDLAGHAWTDKVIRMDE